MKGNVLVIDDDADVRSVLRRKLEDDGYDVCEAADGHEAQRALETVSFDVAITDIVMPERDGIETIQWIRRERPDVKIIAISALSNDLYLDSARGLGADLVFAKPLQLAQISEAVRNLIAS